jgi:hypothetical protein
MLKVVGFRRKFFSPKMKLEMWRFCPFFEDFEVEERAGSRPNPTTNALRASSF